MVRKGNYTETPAQSTHYLFRSGASGIIFGINGLNVMNATSRIEVSDHLNCKQTYNAVFCY